MDTEELTRWVRWGGGVGLDPAANQARRRTALLPALLLPPTQPPTTHPNRSPVFMVCFTLAVLAAAAVSKVVVGILGTPTNTELQVMGNSAAQLQSMLVGACSAILGQDLFVSRVRVRVRVRVRPWSRSVRE